MEIEEEEKKKVLVAGGAGFIGSHLCRRLLKEGNKVICLDNFYTGNKENIKELADNKNFKLIEHNIIEPISLEIDQIYNLACPASPVHYQKDPIFTIRTNVWGIWNMLELAKRNNARLLHTSTSEVYGDPKEHPQKETYWGNVNPIGIRANYDEGKRCAETLIMDYYRQNKTDIKIVRIFNTYGPNMDPDDGRVVSNFVTQALRNEDLTVYGNGEQTRSFCYIDDMVDGLYKMMESSEDFIGPVNMGNPDEFTIKQLAEMVLEMMPESKSEIIYKPLPQDDPKQRCPDITLAKEKLNWQPKIELRQGLIKTINYFK
ncbi:SDR family oxidoreductase [Candidatus Parcubacteria bacterium]|nr:SDR family oxidoreductase [Candidatus Parcubacteria bacterium]